MGVSGQVKFICRDRLLVSIVPIAGPVLSTAPNSVTALESQSSSLM